MCPGIFPRFKGYGQEQLAQFKDPGTVKMIQEKQYESDAIRNITGQIRSLKDFKAQAMLSRGDTNMKDNLCVAIGEFHRDVGKYRTRYFKFKVAVG